MAIAQHGIHKIYVERQLKKRPSFIAFFLCATLFTVLIISSCSYPREKIYKETRIAMYTVTSITVCSDSKEKANTAIDRAFIELDRLANLMNFYSKDSELSAINDNAGIRPVRVSKETAEVIERAVYTSVNTGGSFDVTIGPVVRLWDFKNGIIPSEAALREALNKVGYENIVLDRVNNTVFLKKKGMAIDLGGILKGYSADRAVDILKQNGIPCGIVAVGGEVKAFGTRPEGEAWNVGIKNPRQKGEADEIIATIKLSNKAISTSGDYEKFMIKDGKMYHHLLDPKTGYPVYECQSVSIIADNAVDTDAFATGIFILGPVKGMEAVKKLGLDAVIVDQNGTILTTDRLKGQLKFVGKTTVTK
ncbi:MAG: FAD:protein FMN transferase [Dissulfurispiraceae bacterium]